MYSDRYVGRVQQVAQRREFVEANRLPMDELSSKHVFAGAADEEEDNDYEDDDDDEEN
jgi:hypothetical protein